MGGITIRIKRSDSWKGRGHLKEREGGRHSTAGFGVVEGVGQFRDMLLRMHLKTATESKLHRPFQDFTLVLCHPGQFECFVNQSAQPAPLMFQQKQLHFFHMSSFY